MLRRSASGGGAMSEVGRNVPCPCGSGLKFKRCCLRREDDVALDVARAERVWERMQSWALKRFGDELGKSLKEHMDARGIGTKQRPAMDDDLSLALCWLLIDRELADGGGTPAQRYAELPELAESERAMATRIAQSGFGLHRVKTRCPASGSNSRTCSAARKCAYRARMCLAKPCAGTSCSVV